MATRPPEPATSVQAGGIAPGLSLRVSRTFDAPRARVFRAWTDAEEVKRWMGPGTTNVRGTEMDLRVGGRYRIHMRSAEGQDFHVSGVYREVSPPERVVYTWQWAHEPDVAPMLVTVEFHERGNRTEVVLTHEGLPSEASLKGHEHGWHGCLDKLPLAL